MLECLCSLHFFVGATWGPIKQPYEIRSALDDTESCKTPEPVGYKYHDEFFHNN